MGDADGKRYELHLGMKGRIKLRGDNLRAQGRNDEEVIRRESQ